jgi:hypothetical protein
MPASDQGVSPADPEGSQTGSQREPERILVGCRLSGECLEKSSGRDLAAGQECNDGDLERGQATRALTGGSTAQARVQQGLLAANLAQIDKRGMPAYLESSNRANHHRYQRLGFVEVGEFEAPGGGPTAACM